MTRNFEFCNGDFLELFNFNPWYFYNQFYCVRNTMELLKSMGDLPDCKIEFRYNDKNKIRATFVIFNDAEKECDVRCIGIVFHGDRRIYHCYFYELFGDKTIGCAEVANNLSIQRNLKELDVGVDIDDYFDKICSELGPTKIDSVTMFHYNEEDDCLRLLDIIMDELPKRCEPLLGGEPTKLLKKVDEVDFLILKSNLNNNYLIARTLDGTNLLDVLIDDINRIKKIDL